MSQTPEGAIKCAATRIGMTLEEYKEMQAQGLKRCTKCKIWRLVDEFNCDLSRFDGRHAKCQRCARVVVKRTTKGRISTFKGHHHTEAAKQALSKANKGKRPRLGIRHAEESRRKMSETWRRIAKRGPDHPNWKGGRTELERLRATVEYADWRMAVFSRDNYTCQICGDNRGGNLQAHHLKSFSRYVELRFEVSNGQTLCRECHEKVHLKKIPSRYDLKRRRKHRDFELTKQTSVL